jgi:PAS domain S-box-containing protein
MTTAAYHSLFAAASQSAGSLDAFISANLNLIGTEARLPALARFLALPPAEQSRPSNLMRITDILESLSGKDRVFVSSHALINLEGANVVDTRISNVGRDLSGRDYIVEALETGLPFVSPVEFSSRDGKAFIYFSAPVYDKDEKAVGVLRVRYGAAVLQQVAVRDAGLAGPLSFPILVDDNDLILAYGAVSHLGASDLVFKFVRTLSPERMETMRAARRVPPVQARLPFSSPGLREGLKRAGSPEPFFSTRTAAHRNSLLAGAVARMKTRPWSVVFLQPFDVFLAPVKHQTRRMLLLALAITGVVAGCAMGTAAVLAGPIKRLTSVAWEVAEGNLGAKARIETGGEIGTLAETFNMMTDKLEHTMEGLRESEERYRMLVNEANDMIYRLDPDGRFTFCNPIAVKITGYSEQELIGKRFSELVRPDYRQETDRFFGLLSAGKIDDTYHEFPEITKDGEEIWIGQNIRLTTEGGKIVGVHAVARDITDRKTAEKERLRLVTIVEQAAESIMVTDREGTIQYVNPAFERLTGYSRGEAVGRNLGILKSGVHGDQFYRDMWDTLIRGDVWRGQLVNRKKNGELFQEDATISPVKDELGNVVNYVAVKRDVTDQVMLEKQLRQAQKMESIGTLAGGIAHDFNNILQVVLGYADIMIMNKNRRSHDLRQLEAIRKAAKDGAELVKGLLTFSRQVESKRRPVDLNQQLRRIRRILERTIPKMIDIKLSLADDLSTVSADPLQVEQVLMNLAVNSHHAMPGGGRLAVKTENITLDEEYCRNNLNVNPGDYVLLEISDTGHGIEKGVKENIFEPFFTTKEAGEGTGLGLSIVYGIVKNHGGHITCDSRPGRGTTFKIYLPAIEGKSAPDIAVTTGDTPAIGTETILLADDEERIRNTVEHVLTCSGYTVISADNGKQGLEIYRERKDEIDLVILDLIMPDMGGEQCLEEILKLDPAAKVIIASGYSTRGATKEVTERGARGFIAKPFDAGELLRVVRGILD